MIFLFKHATDKEEVTNTYLQIILDVLSNKYKTNFTLKNLKKDDIVVTSNFLDAYKIYKSNKNVKIINWYQGVIPEELEYQSKDFIFKKIRERIPFSLGFLEKTIKFACISFNSLGLIQKYISRIEKLMLNKCQYNFFVSTAMLEHYNSKYSYTKLNYFVMPCFNSSIEKSSFTNSKKYVSPNFAYVGGLDNWQCFNKIISIYSDVEKNNKNASLKVLTPDVAKATKLIKKMGLKNYLVKTVANINLPNELKNVKYGFLVRDNTTVNRVSTPTKMSNYLANGLIPIYSDIIHDFKKVFVSSKYSIKLLPQDSPNTIVEKILNFEKINISNIDIFNEYNKIFSNYYNEEKYINMIKTQIKEYI